jgi:hypothetical protein
VSRVGRKVPGGAVSGRCTGSNQPARRSGLCACTLYAVRAPPHTPPRTTPTRCVRSATPASPAPAPGPQTPPAAARPCAPARAPAPPRQQAAARSAPAAGQRAPAGRQRCPRRRPAPVCACGGARVWRVVCMRGCVVGGRAD